MRSTFIFSANMSRESDKPYCSTRVIIRNWAHAHSMFDGEPVRLFVRELSRGHAVTTAKIRPRFDGVNERAKFEQDAAVYDAVAPQPIFSRCQAPATDFQCFLAGKYQLDPMGSHDQDAVAALGSSHLSGLIA